MINETKPYMIERIVAALSYYTMGMIGFIWLLLGLFTKAKLRPFMQYHIFQSIFISIAFVLFSMVVDFLSNILSVIPFINRLVAQIIFYFNVPFIAGFSITQIFIYGLLTYLAVTSFMGKYSYVPYVSEIIDMNTGRRR